MTLVSDRAEERWRDSKTQHVNTTLNPLKPRRWSGGIKAQSAGWLEIDLAQSRTPSFTHAHLREMERSLFSTISRQLRLREVEEVSVERLERDKEKESRSKRKKNSHLMGGHCSLLVLVKRFVLPKCLLISLIRKGQPVIRPRQTQRTLRVPHSMDFNTLKCMNVIALEHSKITQQVIYF